MVGVVKTEKGLFKVDSGLLLGGVAERSERSERSGATPPNSRDPIAPHAAAWYTSHGVRHPRP